MEVALENAFYILTASLDEMRSYKSVSHVDLQYSKIIMYPMLLNA